MVAMAAEYRQATYDMVAWFHVMNIRPDLFDDASCLMSEDGGGRGGIMPVDIVKIGMANADGGSADQHLARTRVVDLHLFDG
jgi:hypothetical protein